MNKVYVYARISTDRQGFEQQMSSVEDYLRGKGLKYDEVVADEGVSGKVSYKKRKLYTLLQQMNAGDVLIVSELSRLGRSMADILTLINEELKVRKLRLIIISQNIDLDCENLKAIDEMILMAFAFSAQMEREMIQERTRNMKEAQKKLIAEQGYFISKSGNKRTHTGGDGGWSRNAVEVSRENRRNRALENPHNLAFWRWLKVYEETNGVIPPRTSLEVYGTMAETLNKLGYKTSTGLEFNSHRAAAMVANMKKLFNE